MREAGFYWVRTCNANDWEIAYYNNHIGWHIACAAFQYREDEIHEIDERRIVREEVK